MPRKVSGRRANARVPEKPKRAHYSPSSTGPAGPRLEGQIGAQYLLALLGAGAPRGLPQVATVTRVAFQRAASDHPMDDVIVGGFLANGRPVTLEIQAKRTVAFSAKDKVFADVVRRAVQVFRKPEFTDQEYVVAVAVGRTSTKIEQHVQTALRWARDLQDPATFFTHLQRPGFGDPEAFAFVATFRRHMDTELGAPASDQDVWRLLRRFVILPFDFEAPGSQAEQIALERCALALATPHASRAAELWDSLVEHALALDSDAGDATPESLKAFLARERGYQLAGDRRWRPARLALGHASQDALRDIRTSVLGLRLPRDQVLGAARAALQGARYVEIHGAGGVGKSAVLATLAEEVMVESQVIVLAPDRVPAGGWWALQHQLGVDATAREFLTDLAGDGGAVLFIDGIDRIDDPGKQVTVKDLLRAAADVHGFKVVATAREEFSDPELRAWLPADALSKLGASPAVKVGELTDAEARALASANQGLAGLLSALHPAKDLVRNLFRLERLERIASVSGTHTPVSEAQMARQWWDSADGANTQSQRLSGQHLLRDLAVHALSSSGPIVPEARHDQAVAGLMDRQTLRVARHSHVEFTHDVLCDWAIGCLLVDQPNHLATLPLGRPAPVALARGVEMAARLLAEGLVHRPGAAGAASDVEGFSTLLGNVSRPGAHGSWRRAVLLALVRSECAEQALTRCAAMLANPDAQLLEELIRCVMVVDSRQANEAELPSGVDVPPDLLALPVPNGPSWRHLIEWTLKYPQSVPDAAVPVVTHLYHQWSWACVGHAKDAEASQLLPAIVARLHEWLARAEGPGEPHHYPSAQAWADAQARPRLVLIGPDMRALEAACLFWAKADPVRTDAYLRKVTKGRGRDDFCRRLIDRHDTAAYAAPAALADLFIAVLCGGGRSPVSVEGPFEAWDTVYEPGSPGRRPFLELLQAAPSEGLRLVRTLVAHAVAPVGADGLIDEGLTVHFEAGARRFALRRSYLWSRGQKGAVLGSALMALEAWGHERIERGDAVGEVINDVLGPDGSCAAYLAVAVDLVLSHLPRTLPEAAVFASSAQLLVLDHARVALNLLLQQQEERNQRFGSPLARPELPDLPTRASLQRRPSRQLGLNAMHSPIGMKGPAAIRDVMVKALQAEVQSLGLPPGADEPVDANTVSDPRVAAAVALHRLDPSHYDTPTAAEERVGYRPSELELRLDAAVRTQSWPSALSVQLLLQHAVCDGRVDVAALRTGLEWVDRALAELGGDGQATPPDPDDRRDARRLATIAAMLVLRDGDEPLQRERWGWAHGELLAAIARARPSPMGIIQSVPFNGAAIAGMGLLASLRLRPSPALAHQLLHLAARRDAGMPAVLTLEVGAGRAVDRRLGPSMVRLGLASAIQESRGVDEGAVAGADAGDTQAYLARLAEGDRRRDEREQLRLGHAVQAELDWLEGKGPEPGWPNFPEPKLRLRRRRPQQQAVRTAAHDAVATRAPLPAPQFVVDPLLAGLWLDIAQAVLLPRAPQSARSLLDHYWPWTARANGVGVSDGDLVNPTPQVQLGWNSAYFALLVRHRANFEPGALSDCLQCAGALPVDAFFDAAAIILWGADRPWLNDAAIDDGCIRMLREAIIHRVVSTREWHHLTQEVSNRPSAPLGEVIAALFFGEFEAGRGPKCCLLPQALVQVEPFLPLLADLAERGARSVVVAAAFLSLMDVQPLWRHLHLVARVHAAWFTAHGTDRRFWDGFGAADRLCRWIATAMEGRDAAAAPASQSDSPADPDDALMSMLDALIRVGSPAAQQLERQLGVDLSGGRR